MNIKQHSNRRQAASDTNRVGLKRARCRREQGIALVITLIMLSVTLVMAVAFMALARREKGSVITTTDTKVSQLAAESGVAQAVAQINANALSGFRQYVIGGITNFASSNAFNLHLIVSTNYINSYGFVPGQKNPTNVNYNYANGSILAPVDFVQNVANLWYLPRAPVMVSSNEPVGRFYLDLNENGRFDPNGWQTVISPDPNNPFYNTNGVPVPTFNAANVLSNFFVGDPEWIGVLEHPDAPHGPNNRFTSRYAFIAVPAGNTMDINYIHNQARNTSLSVNDGFTRNQGVGSWEINLAAFFADLNTNIWSPSALPNNTYYAYNQPNNNNSGIAFQDALALLKYRYSYLPLPSANNVFPVNNSIPVASVTFPYDGIDNYSQGPLQINPDFYEDGPPITINTATPWSGADNTNHFFTLGDFFDTSKLGGLNSFVSRLNRAGTNTSSYDRYTFYRMLSELGTDSSPDDGKLNLNYSNAVVTYTRSYPVVPVSVGVVAGAETNLVKWRPVDFFTAASDQLLRTYSSSWYAENPIAFTNTFGITNSFFTITNIPVWVSNRFVYTPAVNRLVQLAANIYDATTNGNFNFPHVFKPVLQRNIRGDIFITGYIEISPSLGFRGYGDPELQAPVDLTSRVVFNSPPGRPILNIGGRVANIYGVPWIIGAKKGLPGFNQLAMVNSSQISRRLQASRSTPGGPINQTNQMYVLSVTNYLNLSFWNSYKNNYYSRTGQGLTIYASDNLWLNFTNNLYNNQNWLRYANFTYYYTIPSSSYWPGSGWAQGLPAANSFLTTNCVVSLFPEYIYRESTGALVPYSQTQPWDLSDPLWPLDHSGHLGLMNTNLLQAYILDGNNVIDYVQFRDPQGGTNLDQALRDPGPGDPNYQSNKHYYWETNGFSGLPIPSWGIARQIVDSESYNPNLPPSNNGQFGQYNQAAATYFASFMQPGFQGTNLTSQAPYTPTRTVFCPYLLQANDPLVHTLASDLSYTAGSPARWGNNNTYEEGVWLRSDDPLSQPLPQYPATPLGGRYQPWGRSGITAGYDGNLYNLAYKDPLVWGSDSWDFPTNLYPNVGWLGRVHRGTPWQTVFLKSTNIWSASAGPAIWINWTGGAQTNYYDAFNSLPWQDWSLFDLFTTRFNDNAVRGTVPVNVGAGQFDGGLAAWSALFSGMVVLTNNEPYSFQPMTYTNFAINPVGVDTQNSPLWKIVNGTNGINATRTNTSLFPYQSFTHVGQILATPALSVQSPLLNTKFITNGASDELYEWLPQQMMGLVRGSEPRYVLYCFGQTLKPAPSGTVLSGPNFQLVTNYQVVAESVIRAVVRIDNANTAQPHVVVESYNVLPPN